MGVEVYRDRAITLLCEIESVIVMIDDKYLLCAIEPGTGGAQQPYRAGAKIATLLPGLTSAFFTACQAVGHYRYAVRPCFVDKDLADRSGNADSFRVSENMGKLQGFNNKVSRYTFYAIPMSRKRSWVRLRASTL